MTCSCHRDRSRPLRWGAVVLVAVLATFLLVTVGVRSAEPAAAGLMPSDPLELDPTWAVEVGEMAGESATADFLGNSYVIGAGQFVRKYTPAGELDFEFPVSDPTKLVARSIAVDRDLNVTVGSSVIAPVTFGTGASAHTLNLSGRYLVQLDRFGQPRWTRMLADIEGAPLQLAVSEDTVIATMWTFALYGANGRVRAFDAATGAPRWAVSIDNDDPEQGGFVSPEDVTLGLSGHVLVGGRVERDATVGSPGTPIACPPVDHASCGFVLDLDAVDGAVNKVMVLGDGNTAVNGIAADASGIAVAGGFAGALTLPTDPVTTLTSAGAGDAFVISFTTALVPTWARRVGGPGGAFGSVVKLDPRHHVVFSGDFTGDVTVEGGAGANPAVLPGSSATRAVLASFDDQGTLGWTAVAGPVFSTGSGWISLAIDDQGVVHTTIMHTEALTVGTGQNAVTLPAVAGVGTALVAFAPDGPMPGSGFRGGTPTRILDSRTATGGWVGPLISGAPRTLEVVPDPMRDEVTAVVLNVTATGPTANAYLSVYPAGLAPPIISNLNVAAGQTVSNLVTVRIGAGGRIELAVSAGGTEVVADIVGTYAHLGAPTVLPERFTPVTPTRLLDSRTAMGGWASPLGPGISRGLPVRGVGPVPGDASSVVLSVTATEGTENSFLAVSPDAAGPPSTSNLQFAAGQTIANLVMVPVGAASSVRLFNQLGSVQVVVDVVGYFSATSTQQFHPLNPTRVLDTRDGTGFVPAWEPDEYRSVSMGSPVIPLESVSLSGNITATNGTAGSYLRVQPNNGQPTIASTLLFGPYQTVPTMTISGMGHNATLGIYNQLGTVDVVYDVNGFFTDA